jgi:hypothetical protein
VSLSESIDTTNAAGKMVFRMLAVLARRAVGGRSHSTCRWFSVRDGRGPWGCERGAADVAQPTTGLRAATSSPKTHVPATVPPFYSSAVGSERT